MARPKKKRGPQRSRKPKKQETSISEGIRAAKRAYEQYIDRQGLKIARQAWREAKTNILERGEEADAESIWVEADGLVMAWSGHIFSETPIGKIVTQFLGPSHAANRSRVGLAILGSSLYRSDDPVYFLARACMLRDIQGDADAYLEGIKEQHE